jgi:hypothetical protein
MWKRMNRLEMVKPMVMIYQIPWGEMNYNGELTLQCSAPFWRTVETDLRRRLYQFTHMRADMVMEPVIDVEPIVEGWSVSEENKDSHKNEVFADYGLGVEEETRDEHPQSPIRSHHYLPQIREEDDIEKIKIRDIRYDGEKTTEMVAALTDVFDGILSVVLGVKFARYNIAPWDRVVMWTGVQEILTDLALRPRYVHKLMERLIRVYESRLDQFDRLNLLALNNRAVIVGQGGYGYTDELPGDDYEPSHVRPRNMWGGGMAQIFSEVSPQMHEEFALDYEVRCMNRFGLVYYGCCEPLHNKVDLARRKIPGLRKISMSPKADVKKGAEAVGDSLVYSCKPNPAFLATNQWNPEAVREDLKKKLDITTEIGCNVEIILKDISTVRGNPRRLWEWAATASELTAEYIN